MNHRIYLALSLLLALLSTTGCALLGPALSDCTKRTISAQSRASTTSALSGPEAPPAAPTTPASYSSPAAGLSWETGVDGLAQDALSEVACVLQEVAQGSLPAQPQPAAVPPVRVPFSPQTGAEPPPASGPAPLLTTPAIAAAVPLSHASPPSGAGSAAPVALSPAAPAASSPVSPAILQARAQTWLDHHCPGGRCVPVGH